MGVVSLRAIVAMTICASCSLFTSFAAEMINAGKEGKILPDPTPLGKIEYINPNIPEIKTPQYPGKSYDALVPATLDLAERARLAINAVTDMTNPNIEYEIYTAIFHMARPPLMMH